MRLWKTMLAAEATAAIGLAALLPCTTLHAADFQGDGQQQQQQQQRPRYVEIPLTGPRADARAAARPASSSSAELERLIQQLGDADFRRREDASKQLKQLDPTAVLEALRQARDTSADPEIASRADAVIRHFDRPAQSGRPSRMEWTGFGRDVRRGRVVDQDGIRRTELQLLNGGRTINILETPDEISISVNGFENGKPASRQYKARNLAALKREHPEAFALYEKYTSPNAAGIQWVPNVPGMARGRGAWRGRRAVPQVMPLPINPGGFPGDAELLRRRAERANAADAQQREMIELMQRMRPLHGAPAGGLGGLGVGGPADQVLDLLQQIDRDQIEIRQRIEREQAEARDRADRALREAEAMRDDAKARAAAALRRAKANGGDDPKPQDAPPSVEQR